VVNGSASVGFALYPEDAVTADSLLSTADTAMYAVKQSRNSSRPIISGAKDPELASQKCA
jgi:predicted signal transduction protein with EAL and GGDEF domain